MTRSSWAQRMPLRLGRPVRTRSSSMSASKLRIVIAGAGPGGLTAARALRGQGFQPILLDKRPADALFADVGGAYDIGREVLSILRALGVEDRARASGMRWKTLETYDGQGVSIRSMDMSGLEVVSLPRPALQQTLGEGLIDEVRAGTEVVGVAQGERVTVALSDGETLECDLLIGADGVHSAVRRAIFEDGPPRFCQAMAAWGTLPVTDPSVGAFPADSGHLLLGPRGSGVGGGMPDRYVWSVLWPAAAYEASGEPGARNAQVRGVVAESLPALLPIVEATDPARVAVVGIWDRDPTPRWSRGRVVLVGDAAHPTSPVLGQGAQSAITDSFTLARLLGRHEPEQAIRQYEGRRAPVVNDNLRSARRLNRLWFSPNPALQWANRLILRWAPQRWMQGGFESANRANEVGDLLGV